METEHRFDVEGYNRTVDEVVEKFKKASPQAAAQHHRFLTSLEAFMEKKGKPIPKHSHRFLPENLWPDKQP